MPGMKALPLPEVLKLLDKLPLKYQAICAIGVTTGCRISEILSLRRFDLLTREGRLKDRIAFLQLKTRRKMTKTARQDRRDTPAAAGCRHRKIAIPEAYRSYIMRHLLREEEKGYDRPDDLVFRGKLNRPLSRLTVYHVFREKMGEGYGTHWMRKTFAQELFRYFIRTNPTDPMRALELTRQALGHARLDTTVKYLGITEQSIEDAQNAIFNRNHGG